MTISSETRKAGPYPGNGVATSFPFAFKVFAAADLLVVKAQTSTGAESVLTPGTDYTVSLNPNQDSAPGGAVVLTAAPASGFTVTIGSAIKNLQPLELTDQGNFYPSVLAKALDRLTILVQQLGEQVGRSLKISFSSTTEATPDQLLTALGQATATATSAAATATSAAGTATTAANNATTVVAGAVQRDGSVAMTGPLTLPGNASNPLQATPLQQVQSLIGGRNRIINGTFAVNQRAFAGGALSAGSYGHDRWKAGAGGATYTVTGEVATITAGTLQQVIEGVNAPEGGTYTLSWTGTAQARVDGGAYAASPITVTGKTAATNTTIEFGTGTVSLVQYESGSTKTLFERRHFGLELALCQRYFEVSGHSSYYSGSVQSGGAYYATSSFKATKRIASPTVITVGGAATGFDASNPTVSSSSADGFSVVKGSNATNAGGFYIYTWTASAEL